jgi:2-amino-4-hydroxy-6-hydroxymethyldihydropteridine diphosphokinase
VNQATHQACLLLGSNIRAEENLLLAVRRLQGRVDVLRASSVWETSAIGSDGPNFLNLALLISTFLDAAGLKQDVLRPLEVELGRVKSADKNAARPIDLDIIVFDGKPVDDLLWKYAYRAVPVSELLPELISDGGERLAQAAERLAAREPVRRRADLSYAFR